MYNKIGKQAYTNTFLLDKKKYERCKLHACIMEKNESESFNKIYVNFDRTDCKSDNVLSAISFIIVTIVIFLSKNGARILKEKKHDC